MGIKHAFERKFLSRLCRCVDYVFSWSTHQWLLDYCKTTLQSYIDLMVKMHVTNFLLFDKAA